MLVQVEAIATRLQDRYLIAVANYNAPQQTVLSGEQEAIQKAQAAVLEQGGKPVPLNVSGPWHSPLMREAADILTGSHDFNAYKSSGSSVKTTVRRIDDIFIEREGPLLTLRFQGNGFLYNMVRILTGTIVQAGTGKIPIEQVRRSLVSRSRGDAGITAPPQGLCLTRVLYPEDPEWDSQKHSEIL